MDDSVPFRPSCVLGLGAPPSPRKAELSKPPLLHWATLDLEERPKEMRWKKTRQKGTTENNVGSIVLLLSGKASSTQWTHKPCVLDLEWYLQSFLLKKNANPQTLVRITAPSHTDYLRRSTGFGRQRLYSCAFSGAYAAGNYPYFVSLGH